MTEHPFLKLLIGEAPVEAFEGPVEQARRRGAASDEVERTQEAALLALQLRANLAERRRREGELAALYETAGDLASIRDVEQVLNAIVRRARRLLRADTAYLAMIDEQRGDAPIRVTEGTVGEEFRRLRLPLGVGLGGLVAQTARASFSADYLHDPRFLHDDVIDSAVGGERIVAILGVPLTVGERVIGVLFAADRTERHFTPDEVNLLGSLAAHAAIAIDNARLFQESEQARAELARANAYVREHSEAVERAAAVHERLTDVVLGGGWLDDVAAALAEILDGTVVVLDADCSTLARSGRAQPDQRGSQGLRDALKQARSTGRAARIDADGDPGRTWVAAVVAGSEQLGALLLAGGEELYSADLRTLERAAQVTALLLLQQRSVAEAEQRLRGEFLEDILAHAQRDPEGLRRRARLLGLNLDAEHVVVVASGGERRSLLAGAARLVGEHGGLIADRGTAVTVVLPQIASRAAADAVSAELRPDGLPVTAGVAGPVAGAAGLAAAYADADRCRRVLLVLGREGEAATVDDLGVYALLFSQAGRDELGRFVDRMLGPVLAYDTERGTVLAETLEAYFAAGGNLTRAAEALHVHVNTLYQRLDRVTAVLAREWQTAEIALQLHLALTIRRLGSVV